MRRDKSMPYIFIVGAGRSGTNLLESALLQIKDAISLGEMRYVWNYGQRELAYDYRYRQEANVATRSFIDRVIKKRVNGMKHSLIIDKTPSNSLRMEFIEEIYPNCVFIHLIRDARANLVSRQIQLHGGHGVNRSNPVLRMIGLTLNTARYLFYSLEAGILPVSRLHTAVIDRVRPLITHLVTGVPPMWGERVYGFHEMRQRYGEEVALACQWRDVVEYTQSSSRKLKTASYIEIRFEDLLQEPGTEISTLAKLIPDVDFKPAIEYVKRNGNKNRAYAYRGDCSKELLDMIDVHIREKVIELGYQW